MLWPVSVLFFLSQDPLIKSLEGKDLYSSYCASCHGMDAKGGGPASAAMKTPPPDLTLISNRHKNKFPAKQVEEYVTGKSKMPASHGSSEMPVWGPVFHRIERDQDLGPIRLRNVVQYLQSIQKPAK